jgi:hypothetical protein
MIKKILITQNSNSQTNFHESINSIHVSRGKAHFVNQKVDLELRHRFIRPLRNANFSRTKVIEEIGFECGKLMWFNCLNENDRA